MMARLGLAECLSSGVTAVLDMGTVRHTDALFAAAGALASALPRRIDAALAVAIAAASLPGSPVRVGEVERGDGTSIVFVAALAAAFVLYAAGLLLLRRHSNRLFAVCAIAAAIQLIPLAGPLLLSHDVYSYWAYARIAAQHHEDPYTVPPASFPADPATGMPTNMTLRSLGILRPKDVPPTTFSEQLDVILRAVFGL